MFVQEIIIGIFFATALFYITRIVYKSFSLKSGCSKNCGGACGTIDVDALERKIKKYQEKNI